MAQVFISYSRKDLSFVERLAADLKNVGLDVWYDVSSLRGGARWRLEIETGIKNSQFVIVVLSPDAVASEWVEREFLFASNRGRKIIPLLFRPCELPLDYLNLNYIDVQGENYQHNFDELLRAMDFDATKQSSPVPVKPSKPPFVLKSGHIVALMGIVAALLVIAWIFWSRDLPSQQMPTKTPASATSISPSQTLSPDPSPTNTYTPTSTKEPFTPTVKPLPTEIVDARGVQMMLVPEGEFTMGSDVYGVTKPVHKVYLDAFYIDRNEVTNALYKVCVDAGVCNPPQAIYSRTHPRYWAKSQFDNYPVIRVDWNMAKTYCEWRGAGLPTEAQWEKAARGIDGRTYPWGNSYGKNYSNDVNQNEGDTVAVGSFELGKSPYGVNDMSGNVEEWVADWYSDTYYQISPSINPLGPDTGQFRVLRGGSWNDNTQTFYRNYNGPGFSSDQVGFRCARSAAP